MSDPRLIIPPPAEPISLADAKSQIMLDSDITADDGLLKTAVAAARRHIEEVTRRQLVLATWRVTLDAFPGCAYFPPVGTGAVQPRVLNNARIDDPAIVIHGGPLQSVLSLKYIDPDGAAQTLSAAAYTVDAMNDPARIMPGSPTADASWPATRGGQLNVVTVNYAAGYMTPFSVDSTANTMTLAAGAAGLETGQAVRLTAIDGTLPAGLATDTNYYAVGVAGLTCQLAATPGGSAIDLTSAGTGTLMVDGLPEPIRQTLRLLAGFFFENRGDASAEIPAAVGVLLAPFKVWRF